jgi:peptidyl-prolyl cis-trans isomerase SurA
MRNNKIQAVLLTALFVLAGSRVPRAEILEQIVVQINSDIVTLTQYNNEKEALFQALRSRYQGEELNRRYQDMVKNILPAMIDEILLVQKAKEFGMTEDLDLEANSYVEDLMKQNNIPSLDALKQEMARSGVRYEDYMDNLKRQILVSRIKGAILHQKIKVMSDEVEKYYQEHEAEFTQPEQVELEEIVIYTKEHDKGEVERRMQAIAQELAAGQSFTELAKNFSEGSTAAQGGNIGLFPVNALAPKVADALKSLQPGQTTGVLEMDFGYQIIRLIKRVDPVKKPLEDVRKDIENRVFQSRLDPVMADYLKELRQQSYIYVFPEFRADYDPQPDSAAAAKPPEAPAPPAKK